MMMHNEITGPARTAGRVIHSARWYDLFDRVMPFLRATRETLVELAAPTPGEHVLDVGCGTGTYQAT
jgi:ubiquinone/menaquinone biosynthesis C-methylase UbiE